MSIPVSSSDWCLQPLRSFWQNVNWDNRAIAKVSNDNTNISPVLSLLMPVREYFRAIAWTGTPEIAATLLETKLSSNVKSTVEESRETLEDFLDDISKFF